MCSGEQHEQEPSGMVRAGKYSMYSVSTGDRRQAGEVDRGEAQSEEPSVNHFPFQFPQSLFRGLFSLFNPPPCQTSNSS